MENERARGGKAAARALQPEGRIDGRLSAGASLDCLYALLGTAALYYWFGELHRHGAPSRALAATLMFSPLIAGIVLALRGHVLPILINVQWGAVSAIAVIIPLLGLRSGDVQRLSWTGVARVLFTLAFIGLAAGLCSLAGGELGGLIHLFAPTQGDGPRYRCPCALLATHQVVRVEWPQRTCRSGAHRRGRQHHSGGDRETLVMP